MDKEQKKAAFLAELVAVCRKHDMALGHQDSQGAFVVYEGSDKYFEEWLLAADLEEARE